MKFSKKSILIALVYFLIFSPKAFGEDVKAFFKNGKIDGNVRNYFQTRGFETQPGSSAVSAGGKLVFDSGSFHGFGARLGFYTANGFGLKNDGQPEFNGALAVEGINVLGEAFLEYSNLDMVIRAGRQKISTPFINPSDAFVIPFMVNGVSISNTHFKNLSLHAMHIVNIRNRQSDEFENAGEFATKRLGILSTDTSGTSIFGVTWEANNLKAQVWEYYLFDLFNLFYLQVDYSLPVNESSIQPFLSIQFAREDETGDALLGEVGSTILGGKLGVVKEATTLSFSLNYVPQNSDSFRNGGILAPFSFATDPLFTNSQMQGLATQGTSQIGFVYKATLTHQFTSQFKAWVSHTRFDLPSNVGGVDSNETDVDMTYRFGGVFKGLSVRNRFAITSSDRSNENIWENRFQIQYSFSFSPFR